jgi:hypothetical protein
MFHRDADLTLAGAIDESPTLEEEEP